MKNKYFISAIRNGFPPLVFGGILDHLTRCTHLCYIFTRTLRDTYLTDHRTFKLKLCRHPDSQHHHNHLNSLKYANSKIYRRPLSRRITDSDNPKGTSKFKRHHATEQHAVHFQSIESNIKY